MPRLRAAPRNFLSVIVASEKVRARPGEFSREWGTSGRPVFRTRAVCNSAVAPSLPFCAAPWAGGAPHAAASGQPPGRPEPRLRGFVLSFICPVIPGNPWSRTEAISPTVRQTSCEGDLCNKDQGHPLEIRRGIWH